jgi:hypothetical protein
MESIQLSEKAKVETSSIRRKTANDFFGNTESWHFRLSPEAGVSFFHKNKRSCGAKGFAEYNLRGI